MTMRIAVVQQEGNPGHPDENRARALAHGEEAVRQGADVVLFHEEMLVGYCENLRELAEPVDGPTTRAFRGLLAGTDTLAVVGLTERDGADCYVAATVVGADGVVANYRKTHLWWKAEGLRHEPSFYRAGDRLVTFDVRGHRCGLMICYDGDFPEMTRSYANLGCSVVLWMNNRGSRGHSEVVDLARRNSMIIAASCCCGLNERGEACRGGSNVTGYDGALLGEVWDHAGIVFADVDPDRALEARTANPVYTGQRPDLYVYGPAGTPRG